MCLASPSAVGVESTHSMQPATHLGFTPAQDFQVLFTDSSASDAHPYVLFHFNASLTLVSVWQVSEGKLW